MGCVLQPGEVNAVAALQPGDTTSEAVQPGQDIDDCFVAPTEVVQINNTNRFFQTQELGPVFSESALGYELQPGGFAFFIENADTGGGPPNFLVTNIGTDWVVPRPAVAPVHARWNQVGGGGSPDGSSTAQNIWVPLSGGIIFVMTEANAGMYQIVANVDLSLDGGLSVHDTAVVDITLELLI